MLERGGRAASGRSAGIIGHWFAGRCVVILRLLERKSSRPGLAKSKPLAFAMGVRMDWLG